MLPAASAVVPTSSEAASPVATPRSAGVRAMRPNRKGASMTLVETMAHPMAAAPSTSRSAKLSSSSAMGTRMSSGQCHR